MKRKRKHIAMVEIAASALADKLPPSVRQCAREAQLPARAVVRMFTPDHIKLHAWGGPDRWWNLDLRLRGAELKAKDRADTSRAAKAVRIDETWRKFTRDLRAGRKPRLPAKRHWPSRPFPKRPPRCEGCDKNRADPPSRLCPGCQAYQDHQR